MKEERARLERWRDGCRQQYQGGGAAAADPQVADHLPRPLGVGQVRGRLAVWWQWPCGWRGHGCMQWLQAGRQFLSRCVALPSPPPLQRVVARHPSTRQLHDGSVLTVAHNCYR